MSDAATTPLLDRLVAATNARDLEGVVACFADDYVNETPAHPARGFRGRDQVRRNWEQMFTHVPDLRTAVLRQVTRDDVAWSEWEMTGTRRDGTAHHMRGVILFGVEDGIAKWARFYLEPVDPGDATVDDAVREQVVR